MAHIKDLQLKQTKKLSARLLKCQNRSVQQNDQEYTKVKKKKKKPGGGGRFPPEAQDMFLNGY